MTTDRWIRIELVLFPMFFFGCMSVDSADDGDCVFKYEQGSFWHAGNKVRFGDDFNRRHVESCHLAACLVPFSDVTIEVEDGLNFNQLELIYSEFMKSGSASMRVKKHMRPDISLALGRFQDYGLHEVHQGRDKPIRYFLVAEKGALEIDECTACDDRLLYPAIAAFDGVSGDGLVPIDALGKIDSQLQLFVKGDVSFDSVFDVLSVRENRNFLEVCFFVP